MRTTRQPELLCRCTKHKNPRCLLARKTLHQKTITRQTVSTHFNTLLTKRHTNPLRYCTNSKLDHHASLRDQVQEQGTRYLMKVLCSLPQRQPCPTPLCGLSRLKGLIDFARRARCITVSPVSVCISRHTVILSREALHVPCTLYATSFVVGFQLDTCKHTVVSELSVL